MSASRVAESKPHAPLHSGGDHARRGERASGQRSRTGSALRRALHLLFTVSMLGVVRPAAAVEPVAIDPVILALIEEVSEDSLRN